MNVVRQTSRHRADAEMSTGRVGPRVRSGRVGSKIRIEIYFCLSAEKIMRS